MQINVLPKHILFVDVETTGFYSSDRIVSLGAILMDAHGLRENRLLYRWMHAIFDPMKKSHPKAEAIHGYDDWTLRHQEPFEKRAGLVSKLIEVSELIVAHNAEFDTSFIFKELRNANQSWSNRNTYCTMTAYRELDLGGSASLGSVCGKLGIRRSKKTHGALEDAWLAMQLFLWLHDCPLYLTPFSSIADPSPQNFQAPPPRPNGPLPRRKRIRTAKKTSAAESAPAELTPGI